jgi:hypothetical protein
VIGQILEVRVLREGGIHQRRRIEVKKRRKRRISPCFLLKKIWRLVYEFSLSYSS